MSRHFETTLGLGLAKVVLIRYCLFIAPSFNDSFLYVSFLALTSVTLIIAVRLLLKFLHYVSPDASSAYCR